MTSHRRESDCKCKPLPADVRGLIRSGPGTPTVIKGIEELVLNSIDAGACKIDVRFSLENFTVRVEDNGLGVSKDELRVLGKRYYTNKISSRHDLNYLRTYGHRGETLASLIETSRSVEVVTKKIEHISTYFKRFQDGKNTDLGKVQDNSRRIKNQGFTITVRGILEKTPVRQRMINKELELEDLRKSIQMVNLMNPGIAITMRNDDTGALVLETNPRSRAEALQHLCSKRKIVTGRHETTIDDAANSNGFLINGIVSTDGHHDRSLQYLFVNRRFVPNSKVYRMIQKHLEEVLGFGDCQSTSSWDSDGQRKVGRIHSPKATTSHKYPVFSINIGCPLSVYVRKGTKNEKVEFDNIDGLDLAIKAFSCQLTQSLGVLKASSQSKAAALRRSNESRQKKTFDHLKTAAAVAGSSLHEKKGAVHSRPAVRDRLSLEHLSKKLRVLPKTYADPDDSRASSSDESDMVVLTQNSFTRAPLHTKKPSTKTAAKPTSRLNHRHSHTIRKSQKRKGAELSPPEAKSHAAGAKKPKLSRIETEKICHMKQMQVEWQDNSSPSSSHSNRLKSSPGEESGTHAEDNEKELSDTDSDISRHMSRISVTPKASVCSSVFHNPYSQSRLSKQSPVEPMPPLDAYDIVNSVTSDAAHELGIRDYSQDIKNSVMGTLSTNPDASTILHRLRHVYPSMSQNSTYALETPDNAIRSRYAPNYCEPNPAPRPSQGSSLFSSSQHAADTSSEHSKFFQLNNPSQQAHASRRNAPAAYGGSALAGSVDLFPSDLGDLKNTSNHSEYALPCDQPVVKRRAKSKASSTSSQSEKRYGRVFSSQDLPLYAVDEGPEQEGIGNQQPRYANQRNVFGHFESDHDIENLENPSRRTLQDEAVGFSQGSLGLNEDFSHFFLGSQPAYPHDIFTEEPEYTQKSSDSSDINLDDVETQRCEKSLTYLENSWGSTFELSSATSSGTGELMSRYFKSHSNTELNKKSTKRTPSFYLDDNNIVLQNSLSLTPASEMSVSSMTETGLADNFQERTLVTFGGTAMDNESSSRVDITAEVITFTTDKDKVIGCNILRDNILTSEEKVGSEPSMTGDKKETISKLSSQEATILEKLGQPQNFRDSWLRKTLPYGARNYLDRTERTTKIPSLGNLDLLNGVNIQLAETVRNCFAETEEDLISNKWNDTSRLQVKAIYDNLGLAKNPSDEFLLANTSSKEVNFWSLKVNDSQVSHRFLKDDLCRVEVIGQVDNKFIAASITTQEGNLLVLFDQHAVHERIRLERLIKESQHESAEGTKGIVFVDMSLPMCLNLTDTEVRIMSAYKQDFSLIGIQFEATGPNTVKLFTAPKCFVEKIRHETRATRDETMVRLLTALLTEQVQSIMQTNGSFQPMPKTVLNVLKSRACKGAIKFGDYITYETCLTMMQDLQLCKTPFQCAHGRPVVVPLTKL